MLQPPDDALERIMSRGTRHRPLLQRDDEFASIPHQQGPSHIPHHIRAAAHVVKPQSWLPRVLQRLRVRHRKPGVVLPELRIQRQTSMDIAHSAREREASRRVAVGQRRAVARAVGERAQDANVGGRHVEGRAAARRCLGAAVSPAPSLAIARTGAGTQQNLKLTLCAHRTAQQSTPIPTQGVLQAPPHARVNCCHRYRYRSDLS